MWQVPAPKPQPATSQGAHQQDYGLEAEVPEPELDALLWEAGVPNSALPDVAVMPNAHPNC